MPVAMRMAPLSAWRWVTLALPYRLIRVPVAFTFTPELQVRSSACTAIFRAAQRPDGPQRHRL
ncbi:hypothetical protein RLIN73S_03203 [Rhodanobacter lindaniclasticus]